MLLLTTNDLLNLVEKSIDTETIKVKNTQILVEFEVSSAESIKDGIRLYFINHEPIELKGVNMYQLFKPNYN